MVLPRRSPVAILVVVLLVCQLALALPESQSKTRRESRATQTPPKNAAPKTADNARGLNVQQIRSGMSLDGRGKLWAVVIGVSSYKNLPAEAQLKFPHRDAEE